MPIPHQITYDRHEYEFVGTIPNKKWSREFIKGECRERGKVCRIIRKKEDLHTACVYVRK